jgi:serine/threonine protein phosphatase 1
VLGRLFKTARQPSAPVAVVPPGRRLYAIGDIHGRLDLLDHLLEQIAADNAKRGGASTELVFLGDLVDRGPSSRGVIERAMALGEHFERVRFLLGNHEEVFLRACQGDRTATSLFVRMGGRATALSYGITEAEFEQGTYADLAQLLAERVPAEHIAFLEAFEDIIVVGDYAFVHAGVRPGIALEDQTGADLRWIRDTFLNHDARHPLLVVHGHTITDTVDQRPNRIGIDTGAFQSNRLTAIGLEDHGQWFLST